MWREDLEWIQLPQDRTQQWELGNKVMNLQIRKMACKSVLLDFVHT
jgi:hypothetical protein